MQYLDLYGSRGMLLDLGPYVESGAIDTTYISESELAGGMLNGKLLAINLGSNAMVGIYDPELFIKPGLSHLGRNGPGKITSSWAALSLTNWESLGNTVPW